MKTSINGKPAEWPAEIAAKWAKKIAERDPDVIVIDANFFTARPYVDEYNRGWREEGFVYTTARLEVGLIEWEARR